MPLPMYSESIFDRLLSLSNESELDVALNSVLTLAKEAIHADFGSLYLIENNKISHKILAASVGFAEVVEFKVQTTMEKGLAGWAFRHQQGALASDVEVDERWVRIDEDKRFGSVIVVPFKVKSRITAILTLGHKERRFFNERALAIAADFSSLAAVVVENVRLLQHKNNVIQSFAEMLGVVSEPVLILDGTRIRFANAPALEQLQLPPGARAITDSEAGKALSEALSDPDSASTKPLSLNGKSCVIHLRPIPAVGVGVLLKEESA
ncbi:MAG: GAF domain-containing protein [Bdellovibrionales bacterium]|nr:GAF domain-containing protein [Bdellovibrionales bacterium]